MPVKSEAQRRFMGAVAGGKVPGVSPEVGKEYLAAPAPAKLPARVSKRKRKLAGVK